jgi:hypothetical protein
MLVSDLPRAVRYVDDMTPTLMNLKSLLDLAITDIHIVLVHCPTDLGALSINKVG